VFGCDINRKEYLVIAHQFKNFFQVPKSHSTQFIPEIIELCRNNRIDIIFPLTDLEVDVFAKNREIFKKYDIVIASPDVSAVKISRSKNLFFNKLKSVSELKLIPTFHNKTILSQCSL